MSMVTLPLEMDVMVLIARKNQVGSAMDLLLKIVTQYAAMESEQQMKNVTMEITMEMLMDVIQDAGR